VPRFKTCQSGVSAIIGILTLAWTSAIALFIASMLLYSRAAAARSLLPVGLSPGIAAVEHRHVSAAERLFLHPGETPDSPL